MLSDTSQTPIPQREVAKGKVSTIGDSESQRPADAGIVSLRVRSKIIGNRPAASPPLLPRPSQAVQVRRDREEDGLHARVELDNQARIAGVLPREESNTTRGRNARISGKQYFVHGPHREAPIYRVWSVGAVTKSSRASACSSLSSSAIRVTNVLRLKGFWMKSASSTNSFPFCW
jgi:hypothetical protein